MTIASIGNTTEAPPIVVALGTSLTLRGGWSTPLGAELTRCFGAPVSVQVVAKSGASSQWGMMAVETALALGPNIVLVEFSINDAALNRLMSPSESGANLRGILERANAATPRPRAIVMAMNPVSGIARFLRPLLPLYLRQAQRVAGEVGADFVDFGPSWDRLSPANLRRAIPDGLHPKASFAVPIIVPELVKHIVKEGCKGKLRPPE